MRIPAEHQNTTLAERKKIMYVKKIKKLTDFPGSLVCYKGLWCAKKIADQNQTHIKAQAFIYLLSGFGSA